ncbi:MAG: N-6 DNA methylase [Bacteroidales bacterium]|jgi:adenine-specific DNA-methyltransferase|nr:N-6 DNA methylase [Bacteroidales bacterium]
MSISTTKNISLTNKEQPSSYADRLGSAYSNTVSQTFKKDNGQFFTPQAIAQFMGSLASIDKKQIDILDPGCGTAILTCALVENLVEQNPNIGVINLVAYEIDANLISLAEKSLSYLKEWLFERGISFKYIICIHDFIIEHYSCLNPPSLNFSGTKQNFDFIISNPPYFKLSKDDSRVKAAQVIIDGQPNVYSIFLAIATRMLKDDGEMIFIIPRSFTSGRYFNSFRNYFFNHVQIDFIHLFGSRKDTFLRDNVLQETLILKAKPKNGKKIESEIIVSTCSGLHDIKQSKQNIYSQKDLIDLDSKEKIIHLPTNTKEEAIIKLFKNWNGSLNQYNIQISTGPIVAFRAEKFIRETPEEETTSLYWIHNITKMEINYPFKKNNKGQYVLICEQTKPYLIPNRNYIFLRRFSAKDDKSRLIAAPYFLLPEASHYIGVENKLNYIYRPKGHLSRTEVMGIAAILNSKLFDTYFRTFNGNVNVSAAEMKAMPMPPLETIKEIGKKLILLNNFSMENVSKVTDDFFELNRL